MKKISITLSIVIILLTGCITNNDTFIKKESCLQNVKILKKENNNIKESFYSDKLNTCLYTQIETYTTTNRPGENGTMTEYRLFDMFTNKELGYLAGCDGELHCGSSIEDALKEFEELLKEYK